jgi:hypothetical protein
VHSSQHGRVSGSSLEQHAPLVAPLPRLPHPYTTQRSHTRTPAHHPRHWEPPHAVAESSIMHAPQRIASASLPHSAAVPVSAAVLGSSFPPSANQFPRMHVSSASMTSQVQTRGSSPRHLSHAEQQSGTSAGQAAAPGAWNDIASPQAQLNAQRGFAENMPPVPSRGGSTRYHGGLSPAARGGSSPGLEAAFSERYTDVSNTPCSITQTSKSRLERSRCLQRWSRCSGVVSRGKAQKMGRKGGTAEAKGAARRDDRLPVIGGLTQEEGNALGAFSSASFVVPVPGYFHNGTHACCFAHCGLSHLR